MNLFEISASEFVNVFNSIIPFTINPLNFAQTCILFFCLCFTFFYLGSIFLGHTFQFFKKTGNNLKNLSGKLFSGKENNLPVTAALPLPSRLLKKDNDIPESECFILESDSCDSTKEKEESKIKQPTMSFFDQRDSRKKLKQFKNELRTANSKITELESQNLRLQEEIEGINHLWEVTASELKDLRAKHQSLLDRALIVSPKDKNVKFKNPGVSLELNFDDSLSTSNINFSTTPNSNLNSNPNSALNITFDTTPDSKNNSVANTALSATSKSILESISNEVQFIENE